MSTCSAQHPSGLVCQKRADHTDYHWHVAPNDAVQVWAAFRGVKR